MKLRIQNKELVEMVEEKDAAIRSLSEQLAKAKKDLQNMGEEIPFIVSKAREESSRFAYGNVFRKLDPEMEGMFIFLQRFLNGEINQERVIHFWNHLADVYSIAKGEPALLFQIKI